MCAERGRSGCLHARLNVTRGPLVFASGRERSRDEKKREEDEEDVYERRRVERRLRDKEAAYQEVAPYTCWRQPRTTEWGWREGRGVWGCVCVWGAVSVCVRACEGGGQRWGFKCVIYVACCCCERWVLMWCSLHSV